MIAWYDIPIALKSSTITQRNWHLSLVFPVKLTFSVSVSLRCDNQPVVFLLTSHRPEKSPSGGQRCVGSLGSRLQALVVSVYCKTFLGTAEKEKREKNKKRRSNPASKEPTNQLIPFWMKRYDTARYASFTSLSLDICYQRNQSHHLISLFTVFVCCLQ